jgi:hypothetical protein
MKWIPAVKRISDRVEQTLQSLKENKELKVEIGGYIDVTALMSITFRFVKKSPSVVDFLVSNGVP